MLRRMTNISRIWRNESSFEGILEEKFSDAEAIEDGTDVCIPQNNDDLINVIFYFSPLKILLFIDSFFFIGQCVWDESESTEKEDMLAFDEVSLYAS
jgi:hypothetical protein